MQNLGKEKTKMPRKDTTILKRYERKKKAVTKRKLNDPELVKEINKQSEREQRAKNPRKCTGN